MTLFAAQGSDPALDPVEVCAPTAPPRGASAPEPAIHAMEAAAYRDIADRISRSRYDLVHLNCLHAPSLLEVAEIGIPSLVTLHVPPFEPFAGHLRAVADQVATIAVSRTLAVAWRAAAPEIAVVANGVDLQGFPFRPVPDAPAYGFWGGRISPEKGLHLAIDAARLAGLPLRFAGCRVSDRYWAVEIAPRLGPGVVDLGHLGQRDLAAQQGGATVALATPCWEEPFGLVVIEALACGTPVAGFRRGALPDLLDGATGRLAAPSCTASLATAIREAMGLDRRACRARARRLFDAALMIERYERRYDEILCQDSGRPDAGRPEVSRTGADRTGQDPAPIPS